MLTTRLQRSLQLIRIAILLAIAAGLTGCYTLLRHPPIEKMNFGRPRADRACTDCHTQGARLGYLRPQNIEREATAWGDLEHPWWIERPAPVDSSAGTP